MLQQCNLTSTYTILAFMASGATESQDQHMYEPLSKTIIEKGNFFSTEIGQILCWNFKEENNEMGEFWDAEENIIKLNEIHEE